MNNESNEMKVMKVSTSFLEGDLVGLGEHLTRESGHKGEVALAISPMPLHMSEDLADGVARKEGSTKRRTIS